MRCEIRKFITAALLLVSSASMAFAQDAVCARVKIEIEQELSFERQAFDANMKISNGTGSDLKDVGVVVTFQDAAGNPVIATSNPNATGSDIRFYIRVDSMENIDNVTGTGVVGAGKEADVHWLIIPTAGTGGSSSDGALYLVGATLTYTLNGEENRTDVTPDSIRVMPMPFLELDYFIPAYVLGDDPFTTPVEPAVPYPLGVRVRNTGHGPANNLKIQSAQPRIVENEQGLLIGFEIIGSEVNGQAADKDMLVNFGNLGPGRAGVARWLMTSSLMGRFVSLNASYSHADVFGGRLTSLIGDLHSHLLIREVVVDGEGKDALKDFLAKNVDKDENGLPLSNAVPYLAVFESDNTDRAVANASLSSSISFTRQEGVRQIYTITTPAAAAPFWSELPRNDFAGKTVLSAVRNADGKQIDPANVWISEKREKGQTTSDFYINLFDSSGGGSYAITLGTPDTALNTAPVIAYINNKVRRVSEPLGFLVFASDANGTIPALSATSLPAGATFVDGGNGSGSFYWTPGMDQVGDHTVIFSATDGELQAAPRSVTITVGQPNASPVAHDDQATTFEGTAVTIDAVSNDTDDAGINPVSLAIAQAPSHGAAAVANGQIVYTPTWGFTGVDSFTYTVADVDDAIDAATVRVEVQPDGRRMVLSGTFNAWNDLAETMVRTSSTAWRLVRAFTNETSAAFRFVDNERTYGETNQFSGLLPFAGAIAESPGQPIVVEQSLKGAYVFTFDTATRTYTLLPLGLDDDGDGLANDVDNCPGLANPSQSDVDGDGAGDVCDLPDGNGDGQDADHDGMPDSWELRNGLNPADVSDSHADPDGDGLENIQEFILGTDPQQSTPLVPQLVLMNKDQGLPVPSLDPLTNGCVINRALLPTTNLAIRALVLETSVVERVLFTMNGGSTPATDTYIPYELDLFDGDYLSHWIPSDGNHTMEVVGITEEWPNGIPGIVTWLRFTVTNHLVMTDGDGDGIVDAWESANGLNPQDSGDALQDADADGLSNLEEFERRSDPRVITPLVDSFVLFNIDQNRPVPGFNPITNGAVINYALLSTTNLEIRMQVRLSDSVKRIKMHVDGQERGIDQDVPYSLSLANGKYGQSWSPQPGSHILRATPYSGFYPNGIKGLSTDVQFTIVDSLDDADTDADGMPDQWEASYGLSPAAATDAGLDPDLDGLTSLEEWLNGTDPTYATPIVESFSLVNVDTGVAVAGYDPMLDGTAIDLSLLPAGNYGIRANVASTEYTRRVRFYVNDSYRGDDQDAPYRVAFQPSYTDAIWPPVAGEHVIRVFATSTPYGTPGIKGPDRYFVFRITE